MKEIIKAFIVLGDLLFRREDTDRSFMVSIDTDMRVLWIVYAAMSKLAEKEPVFEVLKSSFVSTKSIQVPLRLLTYLGREHGAYGDKKTESLRYGEAPYVTFEQLKELESIFLPKFKAAMEGDSLLDNVELPSILYRGRDVTGSFDDQKKWAEKVAASDEGLKKFLIQFSGISISSTGKHTTETVTVQAEAVADFLDLDTTAIKVETLLKDKNIDEKEKVVLLAFLKSYKEQKKNINVLEGQVNEGNR